MIDVRDERYAKPGSEPGLTYDCADDGYFCDLHTIDGIVTCVECGDRPEIREQS